MGRGLDLQQNFQKEGVLTGPQLLEGVAGEGGEFFQGGGAIFRFSDFFDDKES